MLTLFTIPKPFRGHIAVIQRNAIRSWTLLRPACEIILFGDDEGTAEIAAELGVRHVPNVARNEYGTPLVNSIFEAAERAATYDLLCYVNADIILMNDFMEAVQQVSGRRRRFLMVGRRWDVDIKRSWDFGRPDWKEQLRTYVIRNGKLHSVWGIDYFVFPRGLWQNIPPFALGRLVWDNWLIYRARSLRIPVIDATYRVMAVHQNHDYAHHPKGEVGVREGPEAKHNLEIAGGYDHTFTLEDATYILTPSGIKLDLSRLGRHLYTSQILFPHLRFIVKLIRSVTEVSRPLRLRLGLTLSSRRFRHHEL